jgi:hypothetical protein
VLAPWVFLCNAAPVTGVILAAELFLRGTLVWLRFRQGAWRHKEV